MAEAANLAEAAAPPDGSIYRVEPEHIQRAFSGLINNPAVLDFSPRVEAAQITEADAAVLMELGWERLPEGAHFLQQPPTEEQARQNAKFTVLAVEVEGRPAEFVIAGGQDAPVEGRLTVYEAFPYMHGDKQHYVWAC